MLMLPVHRREPSEFRRIIQQFPQAHFIRFQEVISAAFHGLGRHMTGMPRVESPVHS